MVSDRARLAVEKPGMPYKVLGDGVETTSGHVSISTMRLAKGLEFRAVAVMACDDEVIPPPSTEVAQGQRSAQTMPGTVHSGSIIAHHYIADHASRPRDHTAHGGETAHCEIGATVPIVGERTTCVVLRNGRGQIPFEFARNVYTQGDMHRMLTNPGGLRTD